MTISSLFRYSSARAGTSERSAAIRELIEDLDIDVAESGNEPLPGAADDLLLLLASLPESMDLPSLAVEPQGGIAAEWFENRGRTVVVSVNGTGNIEYAGIVDEDEFAGTEPFHARLPEHLLARICELKANAI